MAEEESQAVTEALNAVSRRLPPLSIPTADPIRPFDRHLGSVTLNTDFSQLVSLRRQHESNRAKSAVRKGHSNSSQLGGDEQPAQSRKETAQQALIREMQQAVRQEQERGVGTGLERDARWKARYTSNDTYGTMAGNVGNALLAAGARAAAVRLI